MQDLHSGRVVVNATACQFGDYFRRANREKFGCTGEQPRRYRNSSTVTLNDPTLRLLLSTLLRLLFPSWAFFDEAIAPPTLEVRRVSSSDGEGVWIAAVRAPTRRWWHLVINPEGTRTLAAQTVVERLYLAIVNDEPDSADLRITRALVANVAEAVASDRLRSEAEVGWQWRVVVHDSADTQIVAAGDVVI